MTHESGLRYVINEEGTGEETVIGKLVSVDYVGKLLDGMVFDTSIESVAKDEGVYNSSRTYSPFAFTLGAGQVITGWDIGISLLRVGDSATLFVPSGLGYGTRSTGSIPSNAVLIFDVNVIAVE
jgi:FKBP-type peptidyl-prolyl cis-trans isomerase